MTNNVLVHDPRFRDLILPNAELKKLAGGMLWTEGPAYFAQGDYLLWSDIPNNKVWQLAEGLGSRVFDHDANNCNGHTIDAQGRLISCEHLTRCVTRREHSGAVTVLASAHAGKRLNSPNDVVVKSDGSIWFTDPPYGILSDYEGKRADQEQDGCYVYRVEVGGTPTPVALDFDKPNGLAFSRDESRLYVSDTGLSHAEDGPHHIRVFDLDGDRLTGGEVFAEIEHGVSDGFRVDVHDNLWTSTGRGVSCYDPQGVLLGEILVPEVVANLCFGGPKRNRLFITATTSLYAIYVAVSG
ncbi:SMP-30/gluconolactonase/LRE family protein [uncultured Roseobacter sp.]|uniref:SMP-30/gluconolactonase/LRE family protein n=1 Tax=uncultured Roseobacter sp. TaxID=114847 RepID=UPI00260B03B9|nr:SMP-30/gluconolactonase/LRE family protein [uncultured Roseobacter sp.]